MRFLSLNFIIGNDLKLANKMFSTELTSKLYRNIFMIYVFTRIKSVNIYGHLFNVYLNFFFALRARCRYNFIDRSYFTNWVLMNEFDQIE